MKIVIMSLLVMIGFGFSACSSKEVNHNGSYDQAQKANDKAQNKLR